METVVLLRGEKVDGYVSVDLDVEKLKGKAGTATYKEITSYIEMKHGLKVSSLYIAQIKRKYGIEVHDSHNKGTGQKLTCPPEKEKAILDAFRYFNLI